MSLCDNSAPPGEVNNNGYNWTPNMPIEHHGKWACSIRHQDLKRKHWHRRRIWLDYKQQSDNAILVLMRLEYDQELNTRIKEYFLIFPMVICTPQDDKQFRSYAILKSARLLELPCWAKLSNLRNYNFWPQIQYNLCKLPIIAFWKTFSDFWRILTRLSRLSRTKVIAVGKQRGSAGFSRKLETDLASK
jgi:hypothetical protein